MSAGEKDRYQFVHTTPANHCCSTYFETHVLNQAFSHECGKGVWCGQVFEQVGRQGGTASPFRTRREPIHGDSDETSLFHTVLKGDAVPPRLRRHHPDASRNQARQQCLVRH